MNIEVFSSLISTLGFPVVMTCACIWFIFKIVSQEREDNKEQIVAIREEGIKREERFYLQMDKFSDSLNRFSETLLRMDSRLEAIEKEFKG